MPTCYSLAYIHVPVLLVAHDVLLEQFLVGILQVLDHIHQVSKPAKLVATNGTFGPDFFLSKKSYSFSKQKPSIFRPPFGRLYKILCKEQKLTFAEKKLGKSLLWGFRECLRRQ